MWLMLIWVDKKYIIRDYNSMNDTEKADTVETEVKNAYSDCHEQKAGPRNLDFRASEYVRKWEAIRILEKYVFKYNDFEWSALTHLPEDCKIALAREGSVCIYVKFAEPVDFRDIGWLMKADEISEEGEEVRYWWD